MAQVAWLEHPGYSMRDSTFMLLRVSCWIVGAMLSALAVARVPGCSGARGTDGVVLWEAAAGRRLYFVFVRFVFLDGR